MACPVLTMVGIDEDIPRRLQAIWQPEHGFGIGIDERVIPTPVELLSLILV